MFVSTQSKLYFMVILGDFDNSHYNHMRDRLDSLGKTHRIMENVFMLSVDSINKEPMSVRDVRNIVAGDDLGYCFVIRLNKDFSSAWNLTRENSEYLLNIIEELQDGKTE